MKKESSGQNIGLLISKNVLIILMLAIAVFMTFINPNFLTVGNIVNILRNISVQAILACGVTIVLITGAVDLSFGSTIGLTTVLIPMVNAFFEANGWGSVAGVVAGILLSMLCAVAIGMTNAFFITKYNMPPMIATLAMQYVVYGIAGVITGGYPMYDYPKWFNVIGKGKIGILPISVVIALILCAVFYVILNRTKFGRTVYAVGGSSEASRLSGINVVWYKYTTFVIVQLMAVVAGLVFGSQMMAGSHAYGKDYALLVMSAVIIGGTSIAGGAGNMGGTLKGLLFLGLVLNAMTIANMGEYSQYIVRGALIIFAIFLNVVQNRLAIAALAKATDKKDGIEK